MALVHSLASIGMTGQIAVFGIWAHVPAGGAVWALTGELASRIMRSNKLRALACFAFFINLPSQLTI